MAEIQHLQLLIIALYSKEAEYFNQVFFFPPQVVKNSHVSTICKVNFRVKVLFLGYFSKPAPETCQPFGLGEPNRTGHCKSLQAPSILGVQLLMIFL